MLFLTRAQREPPTDSNAVAAVMPSPTSGDQEQEGAAAVQAVTKNLAAILTGPPASPGTADEIKPAFDIARVEPSGDAVIAGRAAPGASVELLRDGKLHDRVVADASGQFAMVPPRLPPGDYELTLRSTQPDGRPATSKESVMVALQSNLKDRPVVALMSPDKPTVVLSKPTAPNVSGGAVAVETVETEPDGKLYVSGRSSPRAAVRLYLDESYQASTTAAADGHFAFTIDKAMTPGGYRVRLDEVEAGSGAIRSRAEVPFNVPENVAAGEARANNRGGSSQSPQAPTPLATLKPQEVVGVTAPQQLDAALAPSGSSSAATAPRAGTAMVTRGDSLWRISRAAYGTGARYTVIYDANHKQIRNPDRIYPGQVFIIPEKRPE